jgi:hypothetical protein
MVAIERLPCKKNQGLRADKAVPRQVVVGRSAVDGEEEKRRGVDPLPPSLSHSSSFPRALAHTQQRPLRSYPSRPQSHTTPARAASRKPHTRTPPNQLSLTSLTHSKRRCRGCAASSRRSPPGTRWWSPRAPSPARSRRRSASRCRRWSRPSWWVLFEEQGQRFPLSSSLPPVSLSPAPTSHAPACARITPPHPFRTLPTRSRHPTSTTTTGPPRRVVQGRTVRLGGARVPPPEAHWQGARPFVRPLGPRRGSGSA